MQKNLSSPRNKVGMLFEPRCKDWQYNVKILAGWGRYLRWEGGGGGVTAPRGKLFAVFREAGALRLPLRGTAHQPPLPWSLPSGGCRARKLPQALCRSPGSQVRAELVPLPPGSPAC